MRLWLWRGLFATAVVAAFVVALLPSSSHADWFANADKVRHAAAFAVLWALGARARLCPGWALALGLLAFGGAIEVAQSFTTWRSAEWGDWAADGAGVALGAAGVGLWRWIKPPAT